MIPFSEYYELVCAVLERLDEDRRPDRGTVEEDHANGMTPEDSAKAFYEDWNS